MGWAEQARSRDRAAHVKLGGIFMFTGGMNVLSGGSTWYLAHAVSKRVDLKWVPLVDRNPGQVEEGGVPVVGASATGLQLADEIQRAEDDARDLAAHLAGRLDSRSPQGREKLAV